MKQRTQQVYELMHDILVELGPNYVLTGYSKGGKHMTITYQMEGGLTPADTVEDLQGRMRSIGDIAREAVKDQFDDPIAALKAIVTLVG